MKGNNVRTAWGGKAGKCPAWHTDRPLSDAGPAFLRVRGGEAHPLPGAFHSQCQSTDSQHFGLQGSGLIFFFFSKDAELAPRSNDDDSLGTNPSGGGQRAHSPHSNPNSWSAEILHRAALQRG